jgi:5-methyltetrahydropteroyltriglutamate--homocysteine methyltransferase
VDAFKLAVSTADKEFTDSIKTIEAMDADVITIETARGGNRLLRVFKESDYASEIGPGVYDIHSPRVPSKDEFAQQIASRLEVLKRSRVWINPDCGLKTRKWQEVKPALKNMVEAAKESRK